MNSNTQVFFNYCLTTRAPLRCSVGVYLDKLAPSFFRFGSKTVKEFTPASIADALGETMVLDHSSDVQIFNADHAKPIDDLTRLLVCKVMAVVGNTLVNASDNLSGFASWQTALWQRGEFALRLGKRFLFYSKESGIGYLVACRQSGKAGQSDIDSNRTLRVSTPRVRYNLLTRERSEPFAVRPHDRASLGTSLNRAMKCNLNLANFGHNQIARFDYAATRYLRKRYRVITIIAAKAWVAGFESSLHSAKERFESEINPKLCVLQALTVRIAQRRILDFPCSQELVGIVETDGLTFLLVGVLLDFDGFVIDPTAGINGFIQSCRLFLAWVDAILKGFTHICNSSKYCLKVNRQTPFGRFAVHLYLKGS